MANSSECAFIYPFSWGAGAEVGGIFRAFWGVYGGFLANWVEGFGGSRELFENVDIYSRGFDWFCVKIGIRFLDLIEEIFLWGLIGAMGSISSSSSSSYRKSSFFSSFVTFTLRILESYLFWSFFPMVLFWFSFIPFSVCFSLFSKTLETKEVFAFCPIVILFVFALRDYFFIFSILFFRYCITISRYR